MISGEKCPACLRSSRRGIAANSRYLLCEYRMKVKKQRTVWLIDLGMFAGFLAAFFLDLTGLSLHQVLGLAVGTAATLHLLMHLQWVTAVIKRLPRATPVRSRVYLVIDCGLMTGFGLILVPGLIISTWLNVPLGNYQFWRDVHVYSSVGTLALLVIKIGLHGKWILAGARQVGHQKPRPEVRLCESQAALQNQQLVSRRQFVWMMVCVGAVSAAAAYRVFTGMKLDAGSSNPSGVEQLSSIAQGGISSNPTSTAGSVSTQPAAPEMNTPGAEPTAAPSPAANTCQVRCPRGCSYPGRCSRYLDNNHNGRCDYGECL